MRSVGIICECNPFHEGHKYLISRARASGADAIVCLMSGCFVQRGEAAVADPYLRAKALLAGGADLVLELPYPYAAAGAEFFADAGVEILSEIGADELWFGSECGDLSRLSKASDAVLSEVFAKCYEESRSDAIGTAQAYFAALQKVCGEGESFLSNDILGISYLAALRKKQSHMKPVTVQRQGSAYLDQTVKSGEYPSATALRRLISENGLEQSAACFLPETAEILKAAEESGTLSADLAYAERAILARLRLCDTGELDAIAELEGGLGNRLIELSKRATSLSELLSLAATKKYPRARLCRGILFAMTGVTKNDLRANPAYVRVLAANAVGRAFLAKNRKIESLPTVTRQSDLPKTEAAKRQIQLHERAISFYSLCLKQSLDASSFLRRNALILK